MSDDILKVLLIAGVIWLLLGRKKPEKKPAASDLDAYAQERCREVITSGILEKGIYEPAIFPEGLCIKGEANLDGPVFTFGDRYADDQAQKTIEVADIQENLASSDYVTLQLNNSTAADANTFVFDSSQSFDASTNQNLIQGVIDFDGLNDWIDLSAYPDVTGDHKLKWAMYLDSFPAVNTGFLKIGNNVNDKILIFLGNGTLSIYISSLVAADNAYRYDISTYTDQIIECVLTKSTGAITSFSVNGTIIAGTALASAGGTGKSIGTEGTTYFGTGTLWNVRITDLTDTVEHQWLGYPAGNTDPAWVDQVGSIDGTVNGSPATRDIQIGSVTITDTSNPSAVSYDEINRDFSVNPVSVFHIKLILTSVQQLQNMLNIKNKTITGRQYNRAISLYNYRAAQSKTTNIIEIPLSTPVIIDRNTYFEYNLEASETVILIFYYNQLHPENKLVA